MYTRCLLFEPKLQGIVTVTDDIMHTSINQDVA